MDFYCFIQGAWYGREKPIAQVYEEIVAEAVLAEELGYDGIWLAEQNLVSFLATPDPMQLAAMIGQKTKRIRIGLGILVLPFHHPLRLAGEVAQLDVLLGGRLDVGVGRGASPYQLRQFQKEMSEEDSRAYFEESLGIMVRHWSEPEREQAFSGRFFDYPAATVLPASVQRPHPRLWIAALSPLSTAWAVKLGFQSNHLNSPFREPFSWIEKVWRAQQEALAAVGRDPSTSRFAVNRMTYVAPTEADARQILPLVQKGHRVVAQQVDTKKEEVRHGEYITDKPVPNEPSLDEMFDNTLMGTPEQVRAKVQPYHDLGIDQISTWHHLGQSHLMVRRSMELFAREVMPHFRRGRALGAASRAADTAAV